MTSLRGGLQVPRADCRGPGQGPHTAPCSNLINVQLRGPRRLGGWPATHCNPACRAVQTLRAAPPARPPQVYGILGLQLTLTAVVAAVIMTVEGARDFLLATPGVWIGLLVLTLLSELG